MANIKDLKKKIRSTKATLKITTAMKMVAAAKLAKAQEAIVGARPYARELEDTIKTISALHPNHSHPYLLQKKEKKVLLLIISANRGLCGGYNSQLAKKVQEFLQQKNDSEWKVHSIGTKVPELLKGKINRGKLFTFTKEIPTHEEMTKVGAELGAQVINNEVDGLYIAYNVFVSALTFIPTIKKVLPFSISVDFEEKIQRDFPFDFKYDLPKGELLDHLIPESYLSTLYTAWLDAAASEHGARMAAMDSASSNCSEVIGDLTLTMNKLRQAAITTELIEVVSGAEALKG